MSTFPSFGFSLYFDYTWRIKNAQLITSGQKYNVNPNNNTIYIYIYICIYYIYIAYVYRLFDMSPDFDRCTKND